MLRVSIHSGPLRTISRYNRTDWLDIGYRKLRRSATYKAVLFKVGEDALPPVMIRNYPRWSASLWDLAARSIARSLYATPDDYDAGETKDRARKDLEESKDQAPETVPAATFALKKHPAFAESMSAVIQHIPNKGSAIRQIASLELIEHKSERCAYRAHLEEDLHKRRETDWFTFAPEFLRPAELIMRAVLFSLTGNIDVMPPRPVLRIPRGRKINEIEYVDVAKLKEPARTGLVRWLYEHHETPMAHPHAGEGLVPYERFMEFLEKAV
jgi:hypothetical protein